MIREILFLCLLLSFSVLDLLGDDDNQLCPDLFSERRTPPTLHIAGVDPR